MVLDHVAGGADAVVIAGPSAQADVFGHRDLHVVDVVGVPDRIAQLVGEAQRQDVLNRLLTQVVVDAEHRLLGEDGVDHTVEFARTVQVVTERLLDDDPAPPVLLRAGQPRLAQLFAAPPGTTSAGSPGRRRGCRRCRARRPAFPASRPAVRTRPRRRTRPDETQSVREPLPDLLAERGAAVLLDVLEDHLGEVVVIPVPAGEPDQREGRRQQATVRQVVDGRASTFLWARSPVTPNITSAHGPAILGSRLSLLSLNGLRHCAESAPGLIWHWSPAASESR